MLKLKEIVNKVYSEEDISPEIEMIIEMYGAFDELYETVLNLAIRQTEALESISKKIG